MNLFQSQGGNFIAKSNKTLFLQVQDSNHRLWSIVTAMRTVIVAGEIAFQSSDQIFLIGTVMSKIDGQVPSGLKNSISNTSEVD